VHELYAKYDIARLTTEMYLSDLKPAMKPSDAYAHIAQRKTERVEIDHWSAAPPWVWSRLTRPAFRC
jgi:arginine decarboxylase